MRTAYYKILVNRLLITFLLKFKVFNLLNLFKLLRKASLYIIISFLMSRISDYVVT